MNIQKSLALVSTLLLLFLTACQSTPSVINPGGDGVTQLGLISVSETVAANQVSAFGTFIGFETELPDAFVSNPYAGELDECTVTSAGETPAPTVPTPVDDPDSTTSLDAGSELTLRANGASYATLPKQTTTSNGKTNISYVSSESLPSPIPSGLTVSIPGSSGGFPAFSDVAVGEVASFSLTSPEASEQVTPDTTFTWTGSGSSTTYVTIVASAFDFTTSESTTVSCLVADDGNFSFSASTRSEMGATFESTFFSASRTSYRVEQKGDAVLILSASSM